MYHDLVLESAECVFGRKGFEAATMQEVAHEAGISLKTLYAAVDGKADLHREIQDLRTAELIECVREAAEAAADPLDALERVVRAHMAFLHAHPDYARLQLQSRVAWGLGPATGLSSDYWRQGVGRFAELVAAGVESGIYHEGDPVELSMMAQAIIQVQVARDVEQKGKDAGALADRILVQLRRLLCRDPQQSAGVGSDSERDVA
jgi:AcrR family transcriptional regulator